MMKRLFRKGNPIGRLIALWIVFIMVTIPLFENAGPLKVVKAIAGDVKFTLEVDITKFAKADADGNRVIRNADNTGYAIDGDDDTVHNMYYWKSGNETTVSVKGNVTGNLTKDDEDIEYQLGIKVYEKDTIPTPSISNSEALAAIDTYTAMSDEKIYAIYVKITDVDLTGTNDWYLLTAYSLQKHLIGNHTWLLEGNSSVPSHGVKSAYLPDYSKAKSHGFESGTYKIGDAITFPDVHLGTFEYYYAVHNGNNAIGDYNVADLTAINPGVAFSGKDGADGKYISFMKYSDDLGNVQDSSGVATVTFDNTDPILDESSIQIMKGVTTYTADSDGVIYVDVTNNNYGNCYLLFNITEANYLEFMTVKFYNGETEFATKTIRKNGTPINSVVKYRNDDFLSMDDSTKKLALNTVYDVRLELTDEAGNDVYNDGKEPLLAKICLVDKNLTASCIIDNTPDVTTLVSPTNTSQTINLSVTSGYSLTELALIGYDNQGTEIKFVTQDNYQSYISSVQAQGLLFRYTFDIPFPGTVDGGYVEYNSLRISVKDANNQTKEFKLYKDENPKYIYDKNIPELIGFNLYDGSTLITGVNGVYYLDKEKTYSDLKGELLLDEKCLPEKIAIEITGLTGPFEASRVTGTNKYTFDIGSIDTSSSTTEYVISAKLVDAVGNGADSPKALGTINVIDKTLQFVSGSLTAKDDPNAYSDSIITDGELTFESEKSKYVHNLEITFESGYKLKYAVIKDGNNNEYGKISYTTGAQEPNAAGLYEGTLTYTFDDEGENVSGWYIEVKDDNDKKITLPLGDFVYDKTAPTFVDLGIYKANGGGIYTKITDDDLANKDAKEYTVDTTKEETFVILYGAKDATSDIVKRKYYFNNSKDSCLGDLSVADSSSDLYALYPDEYKANAYYIQYTTSGLASLIDDYNTNNGTNVNKVTFYGNATDEADNSSDLEAATYTLVLPDNGLKVTKATLTEQNGNIVNLKEINNGSYIAKEKLALHITATSGYEITTMTLMVNGEKYSDVTVNKNKYDEQNKKYTVEDQIIYIPTDVLSNQKLESIQLVIKDNKTPEPQTYTQSVGDLLFDMSAPTITYADGSSLAQDDTWYQSYSMAVSVKAGVQSIESEIDSVKYNISNSVNDKTDASDGVKYSGTTASLTLDVPESYTSEGTKVVINAADKATNPKRATAVIKVDKTNPTIDVLTVNNNETNSIPLPSAVTIKTTASDNLSLAKVSIVVESEDGTKRYPKEFEYDKLNMLSGDGSRVVADEEYALTLTDGTYKATVTAYDKSGRVSSVKTSYFEVDSTKPVVTAKIADGTKGGKKPSTNFDGTACDYYYSSNVTLEFTYTEKNIDEIVVTDNNNKLSLDWTYDSATGKYVASHKVTSDGLHTIIISATDLTGNEAESKTIYFTKDTVVPVVSAIVNGAISYTDTTGKLMFSNDVTVAYSVSDANEDKSDFNYQLIKIVPDEPTSTSSYIKTAVRSFSYTEEAEYTLNVYAIDMASNKSATKTVNFRVDKTAPNISIAGISPGGTSSSPITVSLNMQELFWEDASGTVEIYMKSGEGFGEELVEEITYTPTGRSTSIARNFSESGIYRIEFNATDAVGHTATASSTFTIDTDVPVVTLEGVSNFDVTDQDVVITSTITDKFYASKTVTVTGTVTDETGKVTPLTIDDYSPTANPTVINKTFSADGIYDLTISCVDVAGNTDSQSVHFIIDKTDPVIGDLSDIDGKILTSFDWDKDLDELVSDLTVCDVHMYLNGQEYNGEDAVEDGSYILLITAEDELGHKVEKEVKFTLDTKAPVFIVTGVEDKESRIEPYSITVSLQLEEDTLTSVTLNGKVVTINNNQATIEVTEIGEYKLYMEAVDEAGNTVSAEYEFELEAEKEFNFWILIGILALLAIIIIIIILKKRKKDQ